MVIEKSSQNPADNVKVPGTSDLVSLADISKTGGVINAYEAIKLASTLKGERKPAPKPKTTVKPKRKN